MKNPRPFKGKLHPINCNIRSYEISACIPIALKGRHLIGIAETGSGKTMTFGIPALAHLQKAPKRKQPTVLVLAPTRELALQIWEQFEKASELCQFKSMVIYGGTPKDEQRQKLRKGIQIVIACPGRLLDLVQEGSCKLDQVDYVILDEADRMLDMGFEKEVRQIIGMTAGTRQILMFSATWPTSKSC
jgi:ATP-dependent RNA helicase DBP3